MLKLPQKHRHSVHFMSTLNRVEYQFGTNTTLTTLCQQVELGKKILTMAGTAALARLIRLENFLTQLRCSKKLRGLICSKDLDRKREEHQELNLGTFLMKRTLFSPPSALTPNKFQNDRFSEKELRSTGCQIRTRDGWVGSAKHNLCAKPSPLDGSIYACPLQTGY